MEKNSQTLPATPFAIRRTWLLYILLAVPAVGLFGAWDLFLNGGAFMPLFSFAALSFPIYLLLFELPHIIAGFFGFFQTDYIKHYRKHLFIGLPIALLLYLVLLEVQFYAAVVVYLIFTLYHVIKQQTGIALFFSVPRDKWHRSWAWLLIIALSMMYIVGQPNFVPELYRVPLISLAEILVGAAVAVTLVIAAQTKNTFGILYVLTTGLMAVVSYFLFVNGYDFLSVLAVRIVHDVTAFVFYITHEMNTNAVVVKNWLYHWIPFLPWSLIVLVPVAAVLIGLSLRTLVADPITLLSIAMGISFAHYYLEGVIWKRDALHRENIRIE